MQFFAKVGRLASEETILQLVVQKYVPIIIIIIIIVIYVRHLLALAYRHKLFCMRSSDSLFMSSNCQFFPYRPVIRDFDPVMHSVRLQ